MIDVQHLTKRYGDFTAVDDISFQARPGEILGFLGPNGAGKTTTLRVLTGFMPPTSGTVIVAGHDVEAESLQARAQVGYLPESVPLYPDMTVRGYLDFVADLRRVPSRRARVTEMIGHVGLQARTNSLIRNLSRGMRQRVGLAQALVHDPPVLILDEPTVGLDPHQVVEVRALIGALGQDRTVMLSTHILSEAEQVCDRVLIIQQGRIVAEGRPDTLRDQLQRGARILLRLADAPDAATVTRLLREVPGVVAVEAAPDGLLVEQARGVDVRGALSAAAIRAGWSVIELRPAAGSLEDVFLEVTSAEVTGPSAGSAAKKAARQAARGGAKPRKERR